MPRHFLLTEHEIDPDKDFQLALQGAKKFVPASPADFDAIEKVAK